MLKIDFGSGYNPNKEYKTCDITGSPILDYMYDKKDTILDLKEKSVDEFYLRNVVHHIPDLKRTFKCLKKYLKNGGKIKIIECMKRSRKMMKGVKFKYFKLQFSFIGWWIFSIFTLGIAALWVNPYVMLANTNFYEEIKNRIS